MCGSNVVPICLYLCVCICLFVCVCVYVFYGFCFQGAFCLTAIDTLLTSLTSKAGQHTRTHMHTFPHMCMKIEAKQRFLWEAIRFLFALRLLMARGEQSGKNIQCLYVCDCVSVLTCIHVRLCVFVCFCHSHRCAANKFKYVDYKIFI